METREQMIPPRPPADAEFLTKEHVAGLFRVGVDRIDRLAASDPTFPAPRPDGWRKVDVVAWYVGTPGVRVRVEAQR